MTIKRGGWGLLWGEGARLAAVDSLADIVRIIAESFALVRESRKEQTEEPVQGTTGNENTGPVLADLLGSKLTTVGSAEAVGRLTTTEVKDAARNGSFAVPFSGDWGCGEDSRGANREHLH